MIGDRLKDIRLNIGVSQKAFAEKFGIPQQTYGKYETGVTSCPDSFKEQLSQMGINLHWLITGQGPMYLDDDQPQAVPIAVQKAIQSPKGFEDVVLVPMTNLKVSAGPGEEWGDGDLTGEMVPVPKKIAARYPGVTFGAAEVRGDSMAPTLRDGEPAIFARDYIRGNGVYVLSVHGDLLVKRLSFNQFEQKLQVISDNPKYPMREIPADMEGVRILGKVLIWVHAEE